MHYIFSEYTIGITEVVQLVSFNPGGHLRTRLGLSGLLPLDYPMTTTVISLEACTVKFDRVELLLLRACLAS